MTDYSDEARRRRRDETEQAGRTQAPVAPLSRTEKEGLGDLLKRNESAFLCTCTTDPNGNVLVSNPRCEVHRG